MLTEHPGRTVPGGTPFLFRGGFLAFRGGGLDGFEGLPLALLRLLLRVREGRDQAVAGLGSLRTRTTVETVAFFILEGGNGADGLVAGADFGLVAAALREEPFPRSLVGIATLPP